MKECYQCKEQNRSWSNRMDYKCKNKCCENYIIKYYPLFYIKKGNPLGKVVFH